MSADQPREVLLVHHGGSRPGRTACERASGVIRAAGLQPVPVSAATPEQLTRDLTDLLRSRSTSIAAVVAVGGDGMAHLVLQCLETMRLQGVEFPFGLVPAGSGNDLARYRGVPVGDVERATGRMLRGLESAPRTMDLIHVRCADGTEHVCATAVCLGLDARVNARANTWPRVRASAKYLVALALEAVSMRARRYDLTWTAPNGMLHVIDTNLSFLVLANTSSIGGGLTILPDADAEDGVLDLFAVSDVGPASLAVLFPRLFVGKHLSLPQVAVEPSVSATASLHGAPPTAREPEAAAYGDGERLGPLPVSVEVLPAAVQVLF
ncbi:diacylglycerol kinase [Kocuria varians]|uniref:Diacylglycerol kinase n=1 Tax=Kocuria varians TaxID=1272 RepID=A0A4Y4D9E2_KOCVA|nr:diacylglycerol kinase family protein [Kocuria varians]GEC99380.1 diacylglycerol kinase [Kocuria varians]